MGTILWQIILPIFLMIGVGIAIDRAFKLDLSTLSKLNFYVFVPALVFIKLQESNLPRDELATVATFSAVHLGLLYLVARLLFTRRLFNVDPVIPRLGTLFYNAGNYGIPLAVLAFGDRGGAIMAIILMVQNLVAFTLGIWMISPGENLRQNALQLLKVPVIWAVVLGLAIPPFTGPIAVSLTYLSDGLIPIALLTLGVQLGRCHPLGQSAAVGTLAAVRLLVSPALALLLVTFWPVPMGDLRPILIVAAGLPVAVNTYVLALEYRREPELAARQIFWTTLLSAITLTVLISLTAP